MLLRAEQARRWETHAASSLGALAERRRLKRRQTLERRLLHVELIGWGEQPWWWQAHTTAAVPSGLELRLLERGLRELETEERHSLRLVHACSQIEFRRLDRLHEALQSLLRLLARGLRLLARSLSRVHKLGRLNANATPTVPSRLKWFHFQL